MRRRVRLGDDRGAYSILYAFVLIIFVALAAILVDLTSVRADRRAAKAAADAGAVAGAGSLGITQPDPRKACKDAVRFAGASLGVIAPASEVAKCDVLPITGVCTSTTAMNLIVANLPNSWKATVFWPVTNESGLMQNPSVERKQPTRLVQDVAGEDGGICSRVGLEVEKAGGLVLGAALGYKLAGGGRAQRSVALAELRPGDGKVVAPLIVLDMTHCNVLNVTGNGGVDVLANGDTPGIIAVDSDASDSHCNTTNSTAIVVTNNSHIRAHDSPTGIEGVILSYAIPDREDYAFQEEQTEDGCQVAGVFDLSVPLCPTPKAEEGRFGRGAFDDRYNCTTCTATNRDYINQFKKYVGIASPPVGGYSPGPAMSVARTDSCTLPATVTGDLWLNCDTGSRTITTSGTTVVSGAKIRIDAKKLVVDGRLVFTNSSQVNLNVDEVSVPSGNCLFFNPPDRFVNPAAPETYAQTCSASTPLETTTGYLTSMDMPPVWLRGVMNVNGSFIARQTFIMQPPNGPSPLEGRMNVSTVGDRIYWSAPFGDDTYSLVAGSWVLTPSPCVPAASSTAFPTTGCFEDLSAWNEWNGDPNNNGNVLNGQSQVFVDGTWFVPDTSFTFGGGTNQEQTRAQFVALQLNLNGSGTLKMMPDAERATPTPFVIGALIR